MRIACEGWVQKDAGGIAGAGFSILQGLLELGYEIDFYAVENFIHPKQLLAYENFSYHPVAISAIENGWAIVNSVPKPARSFLSFFYSQIATAFYNQELAAKISANNAARHYELLFFFGKPAYLRLLKVPTVSWLQGAPQSEWQSIMSLRSQFVALCSAWEYWLLRLFYWYKQWLTKKYLTLSDLYICSSQWTQGMLIQAGIPKEQIRVLPYPMNFDHLTMKPETPVETSRKEITLLWLGRIVPRKRLDLALSALTKLLEERSDIVFRIFGSFPYARGYRKLIDRFQQQDCLFYRESINRSEVVQELHKADILIQPSENEDFGSAVAEALCCGVPVIVGKTNGTKDYISKSCFVIDNYSPQALKKSILDAIELLSGDRAAIALDCRRTAVEKFALPKIVAALDSIFRELIQRNNRLVN